ncbi:hypothetical protein GEV27_00055 [Aeromicrobium sp. S22]|uniref:hypothetical protein n=1 Tax=Aeromicrobium sp. S22 TaxID=2662029 RepID=UPI00129E3B73|nr:hypothetical protein [Aeromicrobium sp. S22]MRJ99903.1 hypothetical protein [Aeromicrobium sp. S22]
MIDADPASRHCLRGAGGNPRRDRTATSSCWPSLSSRRTLVALLIPETGPRSQAAEDAVREPQVDAARAQV